MLFRSPYSCGAGRIFDAVASLIGLCDRIKYQAQAAILLEQHAATDYNDFYKFDSENPLSLFPLFSGIIEDIEKEFPSRIIASKFHNTFIEMIYTQIIKSIKKNKLASEVVLSGGCFQNKYLLEKLKAKLKINNIQVYNHHRFCTGDGSIALGQSIIAAANR